MRPARSGRAAIARNRRPGDGDVSPRRGDYGRRGGATLRTGARIYVPPESVAVHAALPTDDRTTIDVPVQILGDAYITVSGTTRISVENYALPRLHQASSW